jgi:nicotinamidase-related amidase
VETLQDPLGVGEGTIAVPAGPVPFPLEPERTAFLVIDMQRDFCSPGGYVDAMGYSIEPLRKPIGPIRSVLEAIRGTEIVTIFTRYGKRPDLSDEPPLDIGRFAAAAAAGVEGGTIFGQEGPLGRLCIKGDPGWEIVPELLPLEGEPIIEKSTKSSFRFTDLELILRNLGRDRLLIAGVTTDVCVTTTMRDGNDLGYACCLLSDCAASPDPEIHEAMVKQLAIQAGIFGWWSDSAALIAAIEGAGLEKSAELPPTKDPKGYW